MLVVPFHFYINTSQIVVGVVSNSVFYSVLGDLFLIEVNHSAVFGLKVKPTPPLPVYIFAVSMFSVFIRL